MHAEEPSTATLLGMRTRTYMFQPVAQIKLETDFQYRWVLGVSMTYSNLVFLFRRPSGPQWWMKIRSILAILSQHDSTYQVEGLDPESHTDGETLD